MTGVGGKTVASSNNSVVIVVVVVVVVVVIAVVIVILLLLINWEPVVTAFYPLGKGFGTNTTTKGLQAAAGMK